MGTRAYVVCWWLSEASSEGEVTRSFAKIIDRKFAPMDPEDAR